MLGSAMPDGVVLTKRRTVPAISCEVKGYLPYMYWAAVKIRPLSRTGQATSEIWTGSMLTPL
jgi:hypothetical protein